MSKIKAVITGLGAVSPIGTGVSNYWNALVNGVCGIERITLFDPSNFPCQIAAELKDFAPASFMDPRQVQRTARFTQVAICAAREAWNHAGFAEGNFDPNRAAIILGNGIGGLEIDQESQRKLFSKGPSRMSAMTIPRMITNEAAGNIAMDLGIRGGGQIVATACASGTDAIGHAIDWIRLGKADIVLTGGTEAAITEFGIGAFCALKALATSFNEDPHHASRPFDRRREGFIMGEGAGILILESEEHARARGAQILAEAAGSGMSIDGFHLTAPDPDGAGCAQAIRNALKDAEMIPEQIQYINAHGTSTQVNDPVETSAIKAAFSDYAYDLKISSIKGMIGHCLGAAGALEAVATVQAIQNACLPPTINLEDPDPACDLDYIPNTAMEKPIDAAMSTSLGFGGHNGVLILRKYM
ncbi:MAG: beta-ketoacyl-ACP synthase II [Planctomycetia bacterium]|nr:beta-ketoacyl-ACP synthase II [Planctomycetia bacterium]